MPKESISVTTPFQLRQVLRSWLKTVIPEDRNKIAFLISPELALYTCCICYYVSSIWPENPLYLAINYIDLKRNFETVHFAYQQDTDAHSFFHQLLFDEIAQLEQETKISKMTDQYRFLDL